MLVRPCLQTTRQIATDHRLRTAGLGLRLTYVVGGCPVDFIRSVELGSCYKIITPIPSQASVAQSVLQATDRCRQFHPNANLISLETVAELDFLAKLLIREPGYTQLMFYAVSCHRNSESH